MDVNDTMTSNVSSYWTYVFPNESLAHFYKQNVGRRVDNASTLDRNVSISDYPSMLALGVELQAFLITLYSVTALLSLAGNTLVIAVLLTGKRASRELRFFLVNLALSDITMAVFSIPFTYTDFMLGRWIFDPLFCPVVLFMQHVSVIVSVYTLTAIGIDRYYAIMYPLNFRWTRKRGPYIILGIWIVAALLSSVQFVHGRATEFTWAGGTYYDCNENWEENSGKVYTAVIFTVTFMTPMLILTFTYTCIAWKMWRHTSPGNADVQRDQQQLNAKMKVVRMLATVVLMFAVCWLPIHLLNLILYFDRESISPDSDTGEYLYIAAFFSCHWFSMANSFVNPIIYCFMSDNFSADLRQLVRGCCPSFQAPSSERRTLTKHSSFGGSSFPISTSLHNMSTICTSRYSNATAISTSSAVALNSLRHTPVAEVNSGIMYIYRN